MNLFLQLATIIGMLGLTYLVFSAFGAPKEKLLYTKEERDEWNRTIGGSLGGWFAVTNIFGTLTSLATVYIFFIGSSKLFGFWTFLCSLTIWAGAFVTNWFTKRVCSTPAVQRRLDSPDQTGGVIAALFWDTFPAARHTSAIVKYISLLNILSIIWLEFALFADISGSLIGHPDLISRVILLVLCCFAVTYFTLRYGLRGFVFADFFQSPLLLLGSLVLLGGVFTLASKSPALSFSFSALMAPMLSTKDCALFALQVLSLNFLLVLVTEPHWLRVWIFRQKETQLQVASTAATAGLWAALTVIGLFAFGLSGNKVGEPAVVALLTEVSKLSPAFLVAFWIGGMAALFSTADTQIYSALLVKEFDVSTGQVRELRMQSIRPFTMTVVVTAVFAVLYAGMRGFNLPFEKMIFLILPVCLNVFPAFVIAVLGRKQSQGWLWLSLGLYAACSVFGLLQPADQFSMTLLAPVAPIAVAGLILMVHLATRK